MKFIITKPGKKNSLSNSREIFLSFFALFVSVAASTQPRLSLKHKDHKEISITGEYKRIEVWGNVTVLLTNAPSGEVLLEGKAKDFNLVKTTVKDGSLIINAVRKKSLSKLIIYVSAGDVKSMIVNGDADIAGAITTDDLKILLNGEATVRVRYSGTLKVEPADGYELVDGRGNKY